MDHYVLDACFTDFYDSTGSLWDIISNLLLNLKTKQNEKGKYFLEHSIYYDGSYAECWIVIL